MMKRILLMGLAIFSLAMAPQAAFANDGSTPNPQCDSYVIGIPAWYNGMMHNGSDGCEFQAIKMAEEDSKPDVVKTGAKIGLNVVRAAMTIVAYVALFFMIKGALSYIYSAGSPDGIANAKKSIQSALIGLVIAMLASSIVAVIGGAIR